jgi:two-component system response regulator AgrA
MLYFIVLDDDLAHNTNTVKRLQGIFNDYDMEAQIALKATRPEEVVEYSSKNKTENNVYLLDVNVQSNINGIDVANIIRQQEVNAYIVFVSAYPEYVIPSLKTKVFDYLIKPISSDMLTECINSIHKDFMKVNAVKDPSIVIKSGFNIYTLNLNEILYFEKYGHLLVVHNFSGKIESAESLDSIELKLDNKKFFRCHKFFIINISHIVRIDFLSNVVYLKNDETCAVSKRCKKELKNICGLL